VHIFKPIKLIISRDTSVMVENMITLTNQTSKTRENLYNLENPVNNLLAESQKALFLQEVIEGLQDGILIVNTAGQIIHGNAAAYKFWKQVQEQVQQHNLSASYIEQRETSHCLPPIIWNLCESLIDSKDVFSDKNVILFDELVINKINTYRIRVRWLELNKKFQDSSQKPYILITIENSYESLRNVAISEIKKYNFTPREGEIWLLYKANYSYKEIAEELYISINTVKKHMKNIHAKKDEV
jgi:DNA-binding CsgD family transcriptional regulator